MNGREQKKTCESVVLLKRIKPRSLDRIRNEKTEQEKERKEEKKIYPAFSQFSFLSGQATSSCLFSQVKRKDEREKCNTEDQEESVASHPHHLAHAYIVVSTWLPRNPTSLECTLSHRRKVLS